MDIKFTFNIGVILWKEIEKENIKKRGIGMIDIDKDIIMGGAIFALLVYMLALCIVELITTGGLQCTI